MPVIAIGTLFRLALFIVGGGVLLLAFTYLIEFLGPLLIGLALLVIAYLIFKFLTTGKLSF